MYSFFIFTDEKQALTKECDKVKTNNHKLRLEMKSDQERLEKSIKDTSHLSDEVLVMTQKVRSYVVHFFPGKSTVP